MKSYKQRLLIPITGDPNLKFYTDCHLLIANGYTRVVIGGRGPYIEFSDNQIVHKNIEVPENQKHRLNNPAFFYDEYRSLDVSDIKIYHQKNEVSYADYKIGFWYICPTLLITREHKKLILNSNEESPTMSMETEKPKTLWDIL